ncbi:MAG: PDZ domain-containing protein [Acidimicrobiales bacterium]|nr:PDZ domain-containing protein [Acidimicrobiales bacterium]
MPQPPSGDPGRGHGDDDPTDAPYEFRPPLPPEDRIWRHPSEVAATEARTSDPSDRSAPTGASRQSSPTGRNTLALVTASALIGATLSIGVIAALGGFESSTRVVERQVAVQPVTSLAGDGTRAIAQRTAASVAAVQVRIGEGRRDGTAIVYRSDGHLLTTAALVADAETVHVRLPGHSALPASVVGTDAAYDLAVLHVDAEALEPAVLGSADGIGVGLDALVIGHATAGATSTSVDWAMVSAVDRRLSTPDGTVLHGMMLLDELAVDSDGSPLVDATGAVIGITSSIPAADDGAVHSVAAPIDALAHAADQILEYGHVKHVWLGIEGVDLDADDASIMGLDGGAAVRRVVEDGPAAGAGIVAGDVVIAVDGKRVTSMSQLIAALRGREPGDTVDLEVWRGDETVEASAALAERPG